MTKQQKRTASKDTQKLSAAHAADLAAAKKRLKEEDERQERFQKDLEKAMAKKVKEMLAAAPQISPTARLQAIRQMERQSQLERDRRLVARAAEEKAKGK